MRIQISGINDERFMRPLQLISNLFFEEAEIFLKPSEHDIEALFNFEFRQSDFRLACELKAEGKTYEAFLEKSFTATDEKEQFKQMKQAVLNVYVTALQQYTGITQKWGILTGVRPTKLFHKKKLEGRKNEEIYKQLKEDLLVSNEKIRIMEQIVEKQLTVVPDLYNLTKEVSIYIGIPFCPTKCAYCTFPAYAIGGKQGKVDSFLGGLHYEMRMIGEWLKERGINITTVYYGGGTPTSITAEEMDMLYEEMYTSFPNVDRIREITVEAGRPDTITREKLNVLKKWNIDRISVNPQSYIQETLKAIGRHHTVEETIEKFHLAREMGINNINMDLIIGLPGEGLKEFEFTLEETAKLMPESLTVHTLSFKRASEMTKNKEKYKVAERSEVEKMMNKAVEWTKANHYEPYYLYRQKNILGNLENVGYSRKGYESIYNIIIMEEMQTIIGLGCGASSKLIDPVSREITHFANPKDPKSYNDGFKHYTNEKIKLLNALYGEN
ncbi:coproporphyrinogen III oxidase [Aeribacillus composti]|uniref:coproporphyrinogen III oxidase n=1 Tax=Aeribacillus composti TaxID=1868734 RepID=UPI002E24BF3B|nr:coproporphyrinogen III oxidase [Aeribacillus composti]MED0747540.1 coproporphyrinogen III oxidase [Aeribacillus composti]